MLNNIKNIFLENKMNIQINSLNKMILNKIIKSKSTEKEIKIGKFIIVGFSTTFCLF